MNLEEIRTTDKEMLTPADVAKVLRCDAATLRITARQYPERIKFPFVILGNRMKIPRLGFLQWLEGGH